MTEDHVSRNRRFGTAPWALPQFAYRRAHLSIHPNALAELDEADWQLLQFCHGFRLLQEHARYLTASIGLPYASCVLRLTRLVQSGALVSLAQFLEVCCSAPSEVRKKGHIGWLAIPTKNRHASLVATIDSFTSHFSSYDRRVRILVSDDSSAADSSLKESCSRSATQNGCEFSWADRTSREATAAQLACAEIPRHVLEFAMLGSGFLGPTFGANRNSILIKTVGSCILCVDDDTLCHPAVAANNSWPVHTLTISGEEDPTDYSFYPNYSAALSSATKCSIDVLAEHESLLGQPLTPLLAQAYAGRTLRVGPLCSHVAASCANGLGRISVTQNGVIGDSGLNSGLGLLLHRGHRTIHRLFSSEADYSCALTSRYVARQSASQVVCHQRQVSGMFLGLDNSDLLPPFPPLYRNEDGVFAACLHTCFADCYVGHVPFSLCHLPGEPRVYAREGWSSIRVSDAVIALMRSWRNEVSGAPPQDCMQRLGRYLVELASRKQDAFDNQLQLILRARANHVLGMQQALLERRNYAPAHMASDVKSYMEKLRGALSDGSYFLPIDLSSNYDAAVVPQVLRQFTRSYGELLLWWPAILRRAIDVSQE